jgi:hypothetical protein
MNASCFTGRLAPADRHRVHNEITLLSNGERPVEKPGLAEKCAQDIATLLRGSGVYRREPRLEKEAKPGDGKTDSSRRRVTITVIPYLQKDAHCLPRHRKC